MYVYYLTTCILLNACILLSSKFQTHCLIKIKEYLLLLVKIPYLSKQYALRVVNLAQPLDYPAYRSMALLAIMVYFKIVVLIGILYAYGSSKRLVVRIVQYGQIGPRLKALNE